MSFDTTMFVEGERQLGQHTVRIARHSEAGWSPTIPPLEITVTNEWTNRILGDQAAGEGEKVLDTRVRILFTRPELQRSGLMGPVRILAESKE